MARKRVIEKMDENWVEPDDLYMVELTSEPIVMIEVRKVFDYGFVLDQGKYYIVADAISKLYLLERSYVNKFVNKQGVVSADTLVSFDENLPALLRYVPNLLDRVRN